MNTSLSYLEEMEFSIYPNPFNKDFILSFESAIQHEIEIAMYDVLGKLVFEDQLVSKVGGNVKRINVDGPLENGSDLVALSLYGETLNFIIIKE